MPHLIHAHNALYAGALARVIFLKHELPYVITEHSSIYAQGGLRRWQVPLVHDALQTAQGRAVVSVALGELLETRFGEAASPWEWIPNILENEFETLDFEIQANSGHKHGLRFLTIGGLVEIKNQSNLLKAFSHKFKFEKNVELRIGGDGPLRKKLETEAIKLGVADRVVFLGWLTRQRVHEELRNCDAFVLSSNHETFGVVLIEALAYGKPLISTACEGPQCIIKAFNGVLVPPRDPISLGGAMWDVMRKREEYDSLLIRRDCLQRFGEQAIVARLIRFYRQAMSKDD
jgi:glycosyltransferase involved in cell wall biosynthesis